jgi:hypothetical protein
MFSLASLPVAAQIVITVTSPVPPMPGSRVLVDSKFTLAVHISSPVEISTVKASVAGSEKIFGLQPSGGGGQFSGTIDLSGLTEEPWDLNIIATALNGSTGSLTFTVTYNRPPKIKINYLPTLTLDTTIPLHISTDEPSTLIINYSGKTFPTVQSPFNTDFDASPYAGSGLTFNIKATDPGGQSSYLDVTTYIDPSPYLDSLTSYPGDILDLDSARVLSKVGEDDYIVSNLVSKKTFRLRGKSVYNDQVVLSSVGLIASQPNGEILYGNDSVITNMGPSGPISKAGKYVAWSSGNSLYKIHLPSLTPTVIDGYSFHNGTGSITTNGELVTMNANTDHPYFIIDTTPYEILTGSSAAVSAVLGFNDNAVFVRPNGQGYELVAISYPPGTEKILSTAGSQDNSLSTAGSGFWTSGDYVVFWRQGNLGQQNFFRYKRGDADPIRITMDGDSFFPPLRVMNEKGEFIYDVATDAGSRRVLYHNDTLVTISTQLGKPFQYGDSWYSAFHGVIYKYDLDITRPTLNSFSVDMNGEHATFEFTKKMFADAYVNSNSLKKVMITKLPDHGKLSLKQPGSSNRPVLSGDVLSPVALDNLVYAPNNGYTGDDTFMFNSSNGVLYAENAATVTVRVSTILGLEDESARSWKVYPNPFENTLNISVPHDRPGFNVELFTIHGKQVMNCSYEGTTATLDLRELSDGMYLSVVKNGGVIRQTKIIKRR